MKKYVVSLLAVMVVLSVAVTAGAVSKKKGRDMHRPMMQDCEMGMGCAFDGPPMGRLKALGLDDKQMEAVKAIHLKTKKETIRKTADINVAEVELREILSKDPVDVAAAEAKVRQIETMKADRKILHIKAHEEVKAQLTPEQRKKFEEMRGMGMGMGMEMGPRGFMGRGEGMHRGCGMREGGPMGMGPRGGRMGRDMDDDDMPPMHHGMN